MNTAQNSDIKKIFGKICASRIFPYALFFVIVYAVYFKSVLFGLTELDDAPLIRSSYAYLSDPYNIIGSFFKSVFSDSTDTFYRPLLTVSWIIDTVAGGGRLWVYHLSNVIYHFISVCILFNLLKNLNIPKVKAEVFSSFFAALPVLNQAVAWIPGRNDSLLAVFIFGSFLFLVKYNDSGRPKHLLLSVFLFLAALFTKESAAATLIVFPAYLFFFGGAKYKNKILLLIVPMLACTVLWHFMKSSSSVSLGILSLAVFAKAALIKLVPATLQYIAKIFFPVNLKVMPLLSLFDSVAGALIVAVSGLLLYSSRQQAELRRVFFGCVWFFLFLAPTYVQSNYFMLEHRLYVPLLGIILILSEIRLPREINKIVPWFLAVYFIFFAAVSSINTGKFAEKNIFAAAALTETENNLKTSYLYARTFIGTECMQISDYFMRMNYEGLPMEEKIKNDYNAAYHGIYSWYAKDNAKAKEYLTIAAEKNTDIHQVYAVLAGIYMNEGRYAQAAINAKKAFMLKPENKEYYRYMKLCFDVKNNKIQH